MPNDNELQIVLTLIDEASDKLKKITGDVKKDTEALEKTSTKAANTIKDKFKEASGQLRDFRRSLVVVTIALGAIITATREAAKYNKEAKETYDKFTKSVQSFSVMMGQTCGPALETITNLIKGITTVVESAIGGFIKLETLIVGFFSNLGQGPIAAYQQAMQLANTATDDFLKKIEETKLKVDSGMTLDKQKAGVIGLEKIVVKATNTMKNAWEGVIDSMDMLGNSLSQAADMSRGWAKAAAGVALALAIVHTAAGVTRAFEDYPWPFSMVVGGIIAAAGAIQIATIAAQKFHSGGFIRAHSGLAVDEVPIIAQTGEGVLSRRGMSALGGAGALNALNSGYGGRSITVQNYIYNPVVRSDEDIDKLTEEISLRLAREAERL